MSLMRIREKDFPDAVMGAGALCILMSIFVNWIGVLAGIGMIIGAVILKKLRS
jgi:hypothetical protein